MKSYKETLYMKYKKRVSEHDPAKLAEVLTNPKYDIEVFAVDRGECEDGRNFITYRVYAGLKEETADGLEQIKK